MKKLLLLLFVGSLVACNKEKKQPEPIQQSQVPQLITHTLQVVYMPGGSNSELKINLDYPTGTDSSYFYSTLGTITKTYTLTADSVQVFGRSYDANIEIDNFTIKIDGVTIDQYAGKSQTKQFKIN